MYIPVLIIFRGGAFFYSVLQSESLTPGSCIHVVLFSGSLFFPFHLYAIEAVGFVGLDGVARLRIGEAVGEARKAIRQAGRKPNRIVPIADGFLFNQKAVGSWCAVGDVKPVGGVERIGAGNGFVVITGWIGVLLCNVGLVSNSAISLSFGLHSFLLKIFS